MLKNLARMKHAITEWAIKESILDDATFLTQKEWNDRGEKNPQRCINGPSN